MRRDESQAVALAIPLGHVDSSPRRRFLKQCLILAILHLLALWAIGGLIFLLAHVPPKAVNMDGLIAGLAGLETVLAGPRKFLLWVWPGESTPAGLGTLATVLNSLVWGVALAASWQAWRKLTR